MQPGRITFSGLPSRFSYETLPILSFFKHYRTAAPTWLTVTEFNKGPLQFGIIFAFFIFSSLLCLILQHKSCFLRMLVTPKRNVPANKSPTQHTPWRNKKHAGFLVPSKQRAWQPQKHTKGDLEVSTEEVEGCDSCRQWDDGSMQQGRVHGGCALGNLTAGRALHEMDGWSFRLLHTSQNTLLILLC